MEISQIWKEKMMACIPMLYGDKINKDALEKELDRIIEARRPKFPSMIMRNLYTGQNISVEMNTFYDLIKQEDLCIEANNTLTYSYRKVDTPIPRMLKESKKERNVHKEKAKEYDSEISKQKAEGTFVEGSELQLKALLEEALQLKVKVFMNSVYGVQGQPGSMIYNPDTATAVTSQCRQLTSEMLWAMERFLHGNMYFTDFGEYLCYLNTIKESVHFDSPLLRYITYIPSVDECIKIMALQINKITSADKIVNKVDLPLYHFVSSLNETERIYFYYKNNLAKFISYNPRVFELFERILKSPTKFLSPGAGTPEEFLPTFKEIYALMDEFVIAKMSTPNRVFKYQNKRRRSIIISDTDSIIINLNPHVQNIWKLHCVYNKQPIPSKPITFLDEDMDFKIANIVSNLCVHVTEVAGDILCSHGNVPADLRKWCEMKNEFLFKRVIIYKGAKKNYICHVRLREGKFKDSIAATGIKLNSSTMNEAVKDKILDIIENDILKSETVDPINIFRKQKEIERFIIQQIKAGDFTFGKKCRFSGMTGYKTGIYQNNAGRSCLIWNLLNPTKKINRLDYCYVFNTTLYSEQSILPLKTTYPEVYQQLMEKVFHNKDMPELAKYGLKSIAIPISASVTKLPEWLVPYIDYKNLTNGHLQSIITLLPSIGFKTSKFSGNKCTYSPLISF